MEKWKEVPGYEEYYEASDHGRFRRIGTDRLGRTRNTVLKFGTRRGYLSVTFCVEGRPKTLSAHRTIFETFMHIIPDGMQINHKNGIKHDNRLENLEVVTPQQNKRHAMDVLGKTYVYRGGCPGEQNGRSKITQLQAEEIRHRYAHEKISQTALGREYGIDQTAVSRIILGKGWKSS